MQISLPSRQHEIAVMYLPPSRSSPGCFAFLFFPFTAFTRLSPAFPAPPAFFIFTGWVCVWIFKIRARAWQHLWFLRKLHTFSYVGLVPCLALPFYCCQRHENFNFHTGVLVFVEKININHTPQWPVQVLGSLRPSSYRNSHSLATFMSSV